MKRGFEENIPKVRPRVRMGAVALTESVAPVVESQAPAPTPEPDPVPAPKPERERERREHGISEVAALAHELTADLERAAETNARLRSDLEAAQLALRQAAEESRDQRAELQRLSADLEKRAATLAELRGEMDLMEAERDGALAQIARLSRELREARAAAAESAQTKEKLERALAELHIATR